MIAESWLRRFEPCYLLGSGTQLWATDRRRLHRVPASLVGLSLAASADVGTPCLLVWGSPGEPPEPMPIPGFPHEAVLNRAGRAQRLQRWSIDTREGRTVMSTGDLALVSLDSTFVQQGIDDGVRAWSGTTPANPVFGIDEAGEVVACIMPLTTRAERITWAVAPPRGRGPA